MTARREIALLVTGFGPFPGAPFNPSATIARRLEGAFARRLARLGVRLETRILDVTWASVPAALRRLEAELAPDAVLHLGLAGRRRRVTVELRAENRNRPLSPDATRRPAPASVIAPGAPRFRRATIDAARLVVAVSRATPAALSNDAGAYLCNLALWTSLGQGRAGRPAAFIHVPRPASPRARRSASRPTLDALTRMAQAACLALAQAARVRR